MEPRGNKLIAQYKKTYSIPAEANITEQMILDHWKLEKQLTSELLRSTPENRWDTFNRCYTRLYTELGWLNQFANSADPRSPQERFGGWLDLIGPPPKSIYEIGSGQGHLISFLALNGYACKGAEITGERGEKLLPGSRANLSWGMSDGVHLDRFEPAETYDVVVSDQVIEHIHPDDLDSHLASARSILKKGGRYIFNTPNKYTGPHDVSRVFKRSEPEGMHLKEYTCHELFEAAMHAGFTDISYGFVPKRFRMMLAVLGIGRFAKPETVGGLFLRVVFVVERFLATLPAPRLRHLCAGICCQIGVFSGTISLIAEK